MIGEGNAILNTNYPGDIFTGHMDTIKAEYNQLAKKWHPDCNSNSEESNKVMAKINILFKQGLEMLKNGIWEQKNLIKISDIQGKIHEIGYYISHSFELGKMYIGDYHVTYLLEETHQDLFKNGHRKMTGFSFKDEMMKNEFIKSLPKVINYFETKDHKMGIVIKKSPDEFLMRDVLNFYGGKVPEKHVAWIIGTLLNLACYLNFSSLSHNAILMDTYFISPKNHTGVLLGGWWYSVYQGSSLIGLPETTFNIIPPKALKDKSGHIHTDLELIRLMGRELLGDKTGTVLLEKGVAPKAVIEWLRGAATGSAYEDYAAWELAVKKSYGAKRFVVMDIQKNDIYGN